MTTQTNPKISTERREHILLIGLNHPNKLNAFDNEMLEQLAFAYAELETDADLRCGNFKGK